MMMQNEPVPPREQMIEKYGVYAVQARGPNCFGVHNSSGRRIGEIRPRHNDKENHLSAIGADEIARGAKGIEEALSYFKV